jgi:hypothetical protein
MQYAGILENDPTFDDWMEKLANIRQVANQSEDEMLATSIEYPI